MMKSYVHGAPLFVAVLHSDLLLVQALLSSGADVQLASANVGRLISKPCPMPQQPCQY